MIDTHCHLTFNEFAGQTARILADARAAGVRGAITIATTSADCLRAAELARAHDNLWCSAGVHPLYSDQPIDWGAVKTAARDPKCVAWGELGLDNHYQHPPRALQDRVLEEQLAFIADFEATADFEASRDQGIKASSADAEASRHRGIKASSADVEASRHQGIKASSASMPRSLDASIPHFHPRPIIVHCREAFDDLLSVFGALPEAAFPRWRFVFHCFTGMPDDARKVLDFGAWISFTGVVTFANAREVAEAAKMVPADRIMVETDSPFLTPEPCRKIRPNEPKYVVHVAEHIARLRGVDAREFEQILDANAERFFGIQPS